MDACGVILVGLLLGIRCAHPGQETAREVGFEVVLAITNALLVRAILVPSSAALTFLIGLLGTAPIVVGASLVEESLFTTGIIGAWAALPLVVSTVASRIIYGLRAEVREARQFGQYTLEESIGAGGMGEVYRARHALLRRPTAIKLLLPEKAGERSLARFEREVQLTSALTHPNTIAIYDYGHTPDGTFYYAMEYLDGVNLEQLVTVDGSQSAARVIHILKQACASLTEAHGVGMIHRDIKAANIILCERGKVYDIVKVVDFGLVKSLDRGSDLTVSSVNSITGTPLYLSPESIRSPETMDGRSDLYALGAVGYHLLTGKNLFDSDNFMEICSHHLHTKPTPPSDRVGHRVPKDLEGLIMMCLEKEPDRRPKDARSLRAALENCEDAGRWSDEDAAIWWESQAEACTKKREETAPELSTGTPTATMDAGAPAKDGSVIA